MTPTPRPPLRRVPQVVQVLRVVQDDAGEPGDPDDPDAVSGHVRRKIASELQTADMMTKPLGRAALVQCREQVLHAR